MRGHLYRSDLTNIEKDSARFWRKVIKSDGCWLTTAGIRPEKIGVTQYASLTIWYQGKKRPIGAHVFSFLLAYGEIPAGHQVCHTCEGAYEPGDTTFKRCVRPDHLYAGTPSDNSYDAYRNKRRISPWHTHYAILAASVPRGEKNGMAKLTPDIVKEIFYACVSGTAAEDRQLGAKYGISPATVRAIRLKIIWKHLWV